MRKVIERNSSTGSCPRELSTSTGDKTKLTALVLARGGSKGIPLKNLAKVNGVSLLGRTLRIIHNSNVFDELWVSTDHQRIADEAEFFRANVNWRHESTARDESTSLQAVQEFLRWHPNIHNIALIQCTSVFIREKYLAKAAELFRQNADVDCVFAVTRYTIRFRCPQVKLKNIGNFSFWQKLGIEMAASWRSTSESNQFRCEKTSSTPGLAG